MAVASGFKSIDAPSDERLLDAVKVLNAAADTATSFLTAFDTLREGKRGAPTDAEQDLLRAMLVFASAGLDACVKQLVSDALPAVIECDRGAAAQLADYAKGLLRRPESGLEFGISTLAETLTSSSPRSYLVGRLVRETTSSSLQSRDQLFRVAAYFGIEGVKIHDEPKKLDVLFAARNQIAHEMDIKLDGARRKRRSRNKNDLKRYVRVVLEVGRRFIEAVEEKLDASQA